MIKFTKCDYCNDDFCFEIQHCVAEIHAEAHEEWSKYIKAGVCSDCGACSLKEAESKCRPPSTPSGNDHCAGLELWEMEKEGES